MGSGAVKNPRDSYINEFMRLRCAGDVLNTGIFPNAKEITESQAIYWALRKYVPEWGPGNDQIQFVSIGDGRTPRTAGLMAFRTAWSCVGVDPAMKWEGRIDRLTAVPLPIQQFGSMAPERPTVMALVHAHVDISTCLMWAKDLPQLVVVAMPCCLDLYIAGIPPNIEYWDPAVWSPKNLIRIWKPANIRTYSNPVKVSSHVEDQA